MAPDRARGGPSDGDASARVDLHGWRPDEALVRLGHALHRARLRGTPLVEVITGRGLGNPTWKPILRGRVEAWLDGPEGRRHGVRGHTRTRHGGSLIVRLAVAERGAPEPRVPRDPRLDPELEQLGPADLGLEGWDPRDENA